MEPHPIPQNVTSFQFKLVGDMTLKQFFYLASGCVVAYLIFVLFARDYPIIAWPFIILSTLLGIGFAFLPYESRPLDHWVKAFLKAIYSPTKRVWSKNKQSYLQNPLFNSRLMIFSGGNQFPAPVNPIPGQIPLPKAPIAPTQPPPPPISPVIPPPVATNISSTIGADLSKLPSKEALQQTVDLARQAQVLQVKIVQTERTLNQIKAESQKNTPIPVDYSQQVNKMLTDLQSLVNQASNIKNQLQIITNPSAAKVAPVPVANIREKVKVVVPTNPKPTTLALTTFPNVISGIVKDKQNNLLQGVVSVIYDKEGLPVRALKTNKLGQFSGSTPLPNGTYTLELEKEGFTFDVLQIELSGSVLPPLAIIAK